MSSTVPSRVCRCNNNWVNCHKVLAHLQKCMAICFQKKRHQGKRLLKGLCLTFLCCVLGTALAHEDAEFHLTGMTLCIDPNSVQVKLDIPSASRTATAQTALTRSLAKRLEGVFTRTGVDADFAASCVGSDAYTLLTADIRCLNPENYVGFGRDPYNYTLFLQIGRHNGLAEVQEIGMLPDNQYNAYASEIYPEGDEGMPFEQFVPQQAQPLIGQLASYWWEDNHVRSRWAWVTPPLAGGVLALLTALLLFLLLKKRSNSVVESSARIF